MIKITLICLGKLKEKYLTEAQEEYLKRLPGYNCGACGFGGCKGMSEAMLEDINNYKKCKPLRGEKLKKLEEYIDSN